MNWELPDSFTTSYLDAMEWRSGPLEYYEICEMGLIRRPLSTPFQKGLMQPGYLYSPEVRDGSLVKYRLRVLREKKVIYKDPEIVMRQVFGQYRNANLSNKEYVTEMRALMLEYNEREFMKDSRKESTEKYETNTIPMRKCTTCKKPTRNYRCDACWAKMKSTFTACDDPGSEYRLGRR